MSEERIQEKVREVSDLSREMSGFGSFLIFEYLGLDSEETTSLRKALRKTGSKLVIYKNNILDRALKELKIDVGFEIKGPNAILMTNQDIKPFQEIVKLSKNKDFLKLKVAFFENEIIKDQNLKLLSSLGSKDDLIVKCAQTIMSPLYKLAFVLKQISKD